MRVDSVPIPFQNGNLTKIASKSGKPTTDIGTDCCGWLSVHCLFSYHTPPPFTGRALEGCVHAMCEVLIKSEEELNSLDRGSGDGDCGSTFRAGAEGECYNFLSLFHLYSLRYRIEGTLTAKNVGELELVHFSN